MKLFFNCGVLVAMLSFLFGCSSFWHPLTEKTAKKLKAQKRSLSGREGMTTSSVI